MIKKTILLLSLLCLFKTTLPVWPFTQENKERVKRYYAYTRNQRSSLYFLAGIAAATSGSLYFFWPSFFSCYRALIESSYVQRTLAYLNPGPKLSMQEIVQSMQEGSDEDRDERQEDEIVFTPKSRKVERKKKILERQYSIKNFRVYMREQQDFSRENSSKKLVSLAEENKKLTEAVVSRFKAPKKNRTTKRFLFTLIINLYNKEEGAQDAIDGFIETIIDPHFANKADEACFYVELIHELEDSTEYLELKPIFERADKPSITQICLAIKDKGLDEQKVKELINRRIFLYGKLWQAIKL